MGKFSGAVSIAGCLLVAFIHPLQHLISQSRRCTIKRSFSCKNVINNQSAKIPISSSIRQKHCLAAKSISSPITKLFAPEIPHEESELLKGSCYNEPKSENSATETKKKYQIAIVVSVSTFTSQKIELSVSRVVLTAR